MTRNREEYTAEEQAQADAWKDTERWREFSENRYVVFRSAPGLFGPSPVTNLA